MWLHVFGVSLGAFGFAISLILGKGFEADGFVAAWRSTAVFLGFALGTFPAVSENTFLPGVTKECFLEVFKYLKTSNTHFVTPGSGFLFDE